MSNTLLDERWLLPEGVEEALPALAERLEAARRDVLDLFASWGYGLVIPPLVEHLESLLTAAGSDLDRQTFKLTDPLSGRLLGVRADMTPQVARIDARHMAGESPARLCYLGSTLRVHADAMRVKRFQRAEGCTPTVSAARARRCRSAPSSTGMQASKATPRSCR